MNNPDKPTKEEISKIRSRLVFLKKSVDNLVFILFVFYITVLVIALYLNIKYVIAFTILLGIVHGVFIIDIYTNLKHEFYAIKIEKINKGVNNECNS